MAKISLIVSGSFFAFAKIISGYFRSMIKSENSMGFFKCALMIAAVSVVRSRVLEITSSTGIVRNRFATSSACSRPCFERLSVGFPCIPVPFEVVSP